VLFATHKSANKLLQARMEQRQKEGDLNRPRSGGGDDDLKGEADEKGDEKIEIGEFLSFFPPPPFLPALFSLLFSSLPPDDLMLTALVIIIIIASYDKGKEKMSEGSSDSEEPPSGTSATSKAGQIEVEIMETTRVAVADLNRHYSRN